MRKSNLLTKLKADYGTFYMFSEYAESLTRNISEGDAFRLVPSRFAAFDIDYSGVEISQPDYPGSPEDKIGNIFQNYFENCINIFRQADAYGWTYTPEIARHKLYETLNEFHFVTPTEETSNDTTYTYWPELKYIGDVDIVSNTVTDGINYTELYCMIPNSADARKYFLDPINTEVTPEVDYTDLMDYVSGWNNSTYPVGTNVLDYTPIFDAEYFDSYNLSECLYPKILFNNNSDTQYVNAPYEPADEDPFHINTIIVYYDIVVKDSQGIYNTLYYNIPMGIYFTGALDENDDLTNPITKYVNASEVYNQGTSYGLRITTKCTVMPSFGTETNVVDVEVENLYPEFANVCEQFLAAADTMHDMTLQSTAYLNTLKDYLGYFKDKKTNVPYIMNLGTSGNPAYYWFVNGRNTGVQITNEFELIDTINSLIGRVEQLETEVNNLYPNYTDYNPVIMDPENVFGCVRRLTPDMIRNFTEKGELIRIPEFYDICPMYAQDGEYLFRDYNSLLGIPRIDIFNMVSAVEMFKNCHEIRTVDLGDSVNVMNFTGCFSGCTELQTVRINMASIESAASLTNIFAGCRNLRNIYIDNLNIPNNINCELDLSQTKCTTGSLIYILEHIQAKRYIANTPGPVLTIKLPITLDKDSKEITDTLFLINENKHVHVILINL